MPEQFDPYHIWLGIPSEEQPANYYRLLGITLFEDNPSAITSAADQRMAHVRTYQLGKHSGLSQRILNELAKAQICLLNPQKKAAYDEELRKKTKDSSPEAMPAEPQAELDPTAFPAAISGKKRRKKAQVGPFGSMFRFIGLTIAGILGLGTAWLLNAWIHRGDPSSKNTARAEHDQSARKSEEVNTVVDKGAQSAASMNPGPPEPLLEAKSSVDLPATPEQSLTEKTLGPGQNPEKQLSEPPRPELERGSTSEPERPPYPKDAIVFGNHHFKVFFKQATWDDAKSRCEKMGGRLACAETPEKKQFLATLKGDKVVWVGSRQIENGKWQWINGMPCDSLGTEGYAAFSKGADLMSRPLNGHSRKLAVKNIQGFICEWDR